MPIIGLSAHAMAESREKAFEAGMNLYLTKPVKMDELKTSISSLCDNEKRLLVSN